MLTSLSTLPALRAALAQSGVTVSANPLVADRLVRVDGDNLTLSGLDLRLDPRAVQPGMLLLVAPGVHNLTLTNCRLAPGRVARPGKNLDCLQIGNDSGGARVDGVTLDHCTLAFSTDELLSAWHADNLTITNNLLWFALRNAGHPDGAHSMATQFVDCHGVTFANNAVLHCHDRGFKARDCSNVTVRGNVFLTDRVWDLQHCVGVTFEDNTVLGAPQVDYNASESTALIKGTQRGLNGRAVDVLQHAGVFARAAWEDELIKRVITGGGVKLIDSEREVVVH